jgi:hypothetical protein
MENLELKNETLSKTMNNNPITNIIDSYNNTLE